MQRKTSQFLLPDKKKDTIDKGYDIYPSYKVPDETINTGYKSLAEALAKEKTIILDGYVGVDWDEISISLVTALKNEGLTVVFHNVKDCLRPEWEIEELVSPYLGGDDPIFGRKTKIGLRNYFDSDKLNGIVLDNTADINVVYGTGASMSAIGGFLVYFDLPKNELQYRMRAGEVTNLGYGSPKDPKQMYKHFYFVDWEVVNREKKRLLPHISIIVDQQRPGNPVWMTGEGLRKGLSKMSRSCFRPRPWFEPGVWGGQWMKNRFGDLNRNVPNYAWSFEMIVPENGLVFESNGILMEVSFDMLMFHEQQNVLGKAAERFGDEFPIRFDFLDTFQGGNLSVQCHPKPDYIKKEFGENFTQDETYYILDAEEDAQVYLGFQEGIDPDGFKQALQHSHMNKEVLDVEQFVQKFPAKKHDLFLIPHGTVHCSGINNLVLEISATPYIFTFKMYDWLRLDLDGNPRPLNIDRAFDNLNFERRGQVVLDTLISKPTVEASGEDWQKIHLPTHPDHFYDIYRYDFEDEVPILTHGQCHVLMLVEGKSLELSVEGFPNQMFHYAETFAIPAAAKGYTLVNKSKKPAKVIVSFVKDEAC